MDHTTILKLSDPYRKDFYFYGPEILSRRILEERVRNEFFGKSFTYFEIPYDELLVPNTSLENERKVWKIVLLCMASALRGCDLKGFAEEGRGIAILLVDSIDDSLIRFIGRLKKELIKKNLIDYITSFDVIKERSLHLSSNEGTINS